MKPTKRTKALIAFSGVAIFFVTFWVVITIAVSIFKLVSDNSNGDMKMVYIVMLLTIFFLSVICTLADVLRRKIMVQKPTEEILSATEKIARGDFSVRLTPSYIYGKYDEYDDIRENINRMTEELEKSEILKNDFISNISHEIKTPLAIIQSYATLIKDPTIDSEQRQRHIETLCEATKRLTALINDILKLNKLENQGLIEAKESIRLHDNLAEVIIQFETLIESKNLEIEADLDEITIISVKSYLDIIWNNLISNAIKFTENGGKITISLKGDNGRAIVKIADTGCGISKETGMRIFEKFYQGDTSHSQEGNGLGLALVKKIIDIIGGEISVESEIGKGSTFTIVIKDLV